MTEALISVGSAPSINAARAGIVDPAGQRGSSGAIRITKVTGAAGTLMPARASPAGPRYKMRIATEASTPTVLRKNIKKDRHCLLFAV